ncbi:MAG TPA: IS21-like element helper ATPase IstB [Anaerovoracaceae bacterium]|nr:IS21-like element helper ATPase IstB [Anaerovoracaceae bacterium]
MMLELERTRELLDRFGLTTASALLDAKLETASKRDDPYLTFLTELLEDENSQRSIRSQQARLKLSNLPNHKTLLDFDFSFQPGIDQRQIKELATLSFAARKENVIFLGPPGVGKSHLSIALAMEAIKSGLTVYFVSVADLIRDLKKAETLGKLEQRWKVYLRPNVLILDEIGYSQLDRNSSELLFQIISKRYENGSIIMNSNKNFSSWGEVLGDAVMATAMLDRLLHHCTVINIRGGETYRLRERRKAGILTVPPANIPAMEKPALE